MLVIFVSVGLLMPLEPSSHVMQYSYRFLKVKVKC